MPAEASHETPILDNHIVLPNLIDYTDAEFSDTDSFNSDFECSSDEESKITQNQQKTDIQLQNAGDMSEESSDDEDSSQIDACKIFKDALLQLEANITWDAVTEEFKELRSDWRQRVRDAEDPTIAVQVLIDFSKHLLPEAMYDPEYITDEWTLHASTPNLTYNMLCGLLLALEETLNDEFNTFSESWNDLVDSWRETLEEAEEAGDYGSDDYCAKYEEAYSDVSF
uniref:Uncharacterized protein n=1 Tax=Vannella robusta TaxID=1487602 RepID=A0A7S4I2M4_9EUKA|mmetsp:Transcript_19566/g.24704  ORF Transcript_19566/g.24704 Transcript_19566/m.24704 type:complete len:226 (+) Transcript_19566:98-775(+)